MKHRHQQQERCSKPFNERISLRADHALFLLDVYLSIQSLSTSTTIHYICFVLCCDVTYQGWDPFENGNNWKQLIKRRATDRALTACTQVRYAVVYCDLCAPIFDHGISSLILVEMLLSVEVL